MIYIAQIKTHSPPQTLCVVCLAQQEVSGVWVECPAQDVMVAIPPTLLTRQWNERALVLVELDINQNCIDIQDAMPLLLNRLTTADLEPDSEAKSIEQWRQELTLKSQEMSMKKIELASQMERLEAEKVEFEQERQELLAQATHIPTES